MLTRTGPHGRGAMTARYPELAQFLLEHAIQRGSFVLASGKVSDLYCDGKMVSLSGQGSALLNEALGDVLRDIQFDAIGGMEMGAIPIAAAFVAWFHARSGVNLPAFVVRKASKAHGSLKRIEGPVPEHARVVIVEDVVTTAGSILDAIDAVQAAGHTVVMAISMLDRNEGGAAAIAERGIAYVPLVTAQELGLR